MDATTFTTPLRKLVRFFQKSRDAWKRKCQEAKRTCKKWSNQARAVEKSRDHWKEVAQTHEQTIRDLRQQLCEDKNGACRASAGRARGA